MIDESLKNLIIATPVIGVLFYFLKYFMTEAKEERKKREKTAEKKVESDKEETKILEGLSGHLKDSNKKIDYIIKKLDK